MSDNNYTLINGVEKKGRLKVQIQYKNGGTKSGDVLNTLLKYEQGGKKMCFENPLLFALFNKIPTPTTDSGIDIPEITETSEKIVISIAKFGSGGTTDKVSFGFVVDNPTTNASAGNDNPHANNASAGDDNPPTNVIFLDDSLFGQINDDEVKKYALVSLEKYYNETEENNNPTEEQKQIIRTLCKTKVKQGGGNPNKSSTRSKTLTKTRKRKIPKK